MAHNPRGRTKDQRAQFLANSDGTCHIQGPKCTGLAQDVDDIIPLHAGGKDEPSNWRPACRPCNRGKGAAEGNRKRGQARAQAKNASMNGVAVPSRRKSDPARGVLHPLQVPATGSDRLVTRPRAVKGLVRPRLETPRTPRVRSLGPEAVGWINESGVLGTYRLLPWQEYALTRSLELRPDGRLRWRTVIVTIARQQGKSVLARSLLWWRMHQGERFGEQQVILHTANLSQTGREVWRPAALHAIARYGKGASKFGHGFEQVDLTEHGHGRWMVQAANDSTGVGYSLSMGLVDEAWNVPRRVVDEALVPAMSEREQPQLWLVSTAGDSSSDLLQAYRDMALQDTHGTGDVLLLEWSTPPDMPVDHPDAWRWASPHWTPRREDFLRSQLQAVPETAFRTQYLNAWVKTVDAWIPPAVWSSTGRVAAVDGRPGVAAIEVSAEGDRFALVTAWQSEDGSIDVRGRVTNAQTVLWRWLDDVDPRRLLIPPRLVPMIGRRRCETVGTTELGRWLTAVGAGIAGGTVHHDPVDQVLTDDMARAVAVHTESGLHLSVKKSPGPTEAARALVWAVGALIAPGTPRPAIRAVQHTA